MSSRGEIGDIDRVAARLDDSREAKMSFVRATGSRDGPPSEPGRRAAQLSKNEIKAAGFCPHRGQILELYSYVH
jgi:hypothetical protein